MPQQSDRVVRIEVQLPIELAARFNADVGPRNRNAWVVYLISKHLGVPYKARHRGRPRKPEDRG